MPPHTATSSDGRGPRSRPLQKVVTDPVTGEELYRKEEPLSEHRDRGSAKKKNRH